MQQGHRKENADSKQNPESQAHEPKPQARADRRLRPQPSQSAVAPNRIRDVFRKNVDWKFDHRPIRNYWLGDVVAVAAAVVFAGGGGAFVGGLAFRSEGSS